ncbi:odorant receptor 4-like isoform X2 [Nomia melanderi]|uniref:odorant receptor 4-like isoform X2 n=1 Tax=Nomia melanderi TaxID=2448451 RepID=UPI003FCC2ACB
MHNQLCLVPLGDQSLRSVLHVSTMRTLIVQEHSSRKPRNPFYEQDIVHVLRHPRWILRSIGIWPTFLTSRRRILPSFLIGLCNLLLLYALIPLSLHITLEEKNTTVRLHLCGPLIFSVVSLMKYWALAACKPRIKHCVERLENDWKQVKHHEDRELMLKYGNIGRSLTLHCMGFMYTGGFMYHAVLQIASGSHVDERNRTIKPMIYPTYSGIYNSQESPVYEMVYASHLMCGYVAYTVTAGACGLAATFATHVCGQIDVMMHRLNNLVDLKNKGEIDRRMIQIVEHHIRTLRFSATVETLLQEVCFLEFVGSIFLMCLLEYYILMDWGSNTLSFVTYFALLISLMFNIFILCYIGDLLVEKTGNVGISCFMMDWYKFPTDTIRALIMIIDSQNVTGLSKLTPDSRVTGNIRRK